MTSGWQALGLTQQQQHQLEAGSGGGNVRAGTESLQRQLCMVCKSILLESATYCLSCWLQQHVQKGTF
jgi:hypothetical protein